MREAAEHLRQRLLDRGEMDIDGTGVGGDIAGSEPAGPTGRDGEEDVWKVSLEALCEDIDEIEARATVGLKGEEERRWREWISGRY